MTERGAGLDIEDAVQLVQQRLSQDIDQFLTMIADDRVRASILLGGVVAPLRPVRPMSLEDVPETRLQLRDQQVPRRREVSLEESGETDVTKTQQT